MAGLKDYTAEELDGELLDLHATNKLLNTNNLQGADAFLENLRQRGLLLKDQEKLEIIFSDCFYKTYLCSIIKIIMY